LTYLCVLIHRMFAEINAQTFRLEILMSAPELGLWVIAPRGNCHVRDTLKRHTLGSNRVDWCRIFRSRPPDLGRECILKKGEKFADGPLHPYGDRRLLSWL
jgi:hypothetical protein